LISSAARARWAFWRALGGPPLAAAGRRAGDQRLGGGAPGQVVGLEGGHRAAEELQRQVALVAAHPGHGRAGRELFQRLRERRGLAEARRRAHQHERARRYRVDQAALQRQARHQRPRSRPRRLELGAGEVEQAAGAGRRERVFLPLRRSQGDGDARHARPRQHRRPVRRAVGRTGERWHAADSGDRPDDA